MSISPKELDRPKGCSVKPRHLFHTSGWTMLKYISIQNLNQIYHAVQSYEHLHQKSSIGQNDAR